MSGVYSVHAYVDYRTGPLAWLPLHSCGLHHRCIPYHDFLSVDSRLDSVTGDLLHPFDDAVVILFRIGIPQGSGYRVSGVPLHVGGEMQQFLPGQFFRMYRGHLEHSFRQCARLVEYHRIQFCKGFKIIRSFDKDALSGSSAYASEECQRNRDNQGARAGNDQKGERAVEPFSDIAGEVSRQ